jgi:hypothetical protein
MVSAGQLPKKNGDNLEQSLARLRPHSPTKSRIQSLLADASWDPAVCGGGIACEGTATIRL